MVGLTILGLLISIDEYRNRKVQITYHKYIDDLYRKKGVGMKKIR